MARGKTSSSSRREGAPATASSKKYDGRPPADDNRPMEARLDAIEYHWKSFSPLAKKFTLANPKDLTFRKLIDFWSSPDQIEVAEMAVSVGTAHLLAYEYFNISAFENARALALTGGFFQQLTETPMEKIKSLLSGDPNDEQFRHYITAFRCCKDTTSLEKYLIRVLPLKYQKMMGFSSHAANRPGMEYVDLIGDDWNGSSGNKKKQDNNLDDGLEISIVMLNKDTGAEHEKKINANNSIKSLFNEYAEESGVPLRSLRFKFNGSTLFLSSVGQKTPTDLEMKHGSIIEVYDINATKTEAENKSSINGTSNSKPNKKQTSKSGKGKKAKKSSRGSQVVISVPNSPKELHSVMMSKVFEEADPRFKLIRQKLNELLLDCQCPKSKKAGRRKKSGDNPEVVFNPLMDGIGGKAGKTSFAINVGRIENLYKTSKRSSVCKRSADVPFTSKVDLHGCTRVEALERLDKNLTEWVDMAMHGKYPWVIPAVIVCGGGNQILSETVEAWIRDKKNVANAPKGNIHMQ